MNYWLTQPAKEDLLLIWEYSEEQWGQDQADRYMDSLETRFAWLTINSGLWKPRPDIKPGIYSYREQSHSIIFWQQHGGIEILRVLHSRMDPERHLPETTDK